MTGKIFTALANHSHEMRKAQLVALLSLIGSSFFLAATIACVMGGFGSPTLKAAAYPALVATMSLWGICIFACLKDILDQAVDGGKKT